MRTGTLNARSLFKSGSFKTAGELTKYNLDLMAVQEVRWEKGGSEPLDYYTFLCETGNINRDLGTGVFVSKEIRLAL
jgi:hypothetical protein